MSKLLICLSKLFDAAVFTVRVQEGKAAVSILLAHVTIYDLLLLLYLQYFRCMQVRQVAC